MSIRDIEFKAVSDAVAGAAIDFALNTHAYWIFFGTRCEQAKELMVEVAALYADFPNDAQIIFCTETPIYAILLASKKRLPIPQLSEILSRAGMRVEPKVLETQDVIMLSDASTEEAAWEWFKKVTRLGERKFS